MPEQLALDIGPSCKDHGCTAPVVGHSITGSGYVCRSANEREWGAALSLSRDPYYRDLGSRLLNASAAVTL